MLQKLNNQSGELVRLFLSAFHYSRFVMRNSWYCPYGVLIVMQGDLEQEPSVADWVQDVLQRQKVKVALRRKDNLEEQLTGKNLV
jgi:hypothetical protein